MSKIYMNQMNRIIYFQRNTGNYRIACHSRQWWAILCLFFTAAHPNTKIKLGYLSGFRQDTLLLQAWITSGTWNYATNFPGCWLGFLFPPRQAAARGVDANWCCGCQMYAWFVCDIARWIYSVDNKWLRESVGLLSVSVNDSEIDKAIEARWCCHLLTLWHSIQISLVSPCYKIADRNNKTTQNAISARKPYCQINIVWKFWLFRYCAKTWCERHS